MSLASPYKLGLVCLTFQGEELKEAVKSEFFPWLAQYLVMKRVSIEPNFHDLYIKFMETLEWKELFQMVLQETYRNIKVYTKLMNWIVRSG